MNIAHSAGPDILKAQERAVRLGVLLDMGSLLPVVAIAVLSGSMLLYADMLDYARSIAAGTIAWGILRRIRKGDVHDYDYGTGKLESLGGVIGSLLFMLGLLGMAGFALNRIFHPLELHAGFTALGVLSQLIGLLISGWLWWRNLKLARLANSPLIEMEWRAKRADTLSCLVVLVALVLTLVLRPLSWSIYIDPACALFFTVYALASFVPTVRDGVLDLLDKTLGEELQLKITRNLARHFDGYDGFHGVRSRRMGRRVLIDIALSFAPDKTMREVMDTVARLRQDLRQDIPHGEVSIILESPEPAAPPDDEGSRVRILPLSRETLPAALKLIRASFRFESDDKPEWEMEESLEPGKHTAQLEALGLRQPRHWVLCDRDEVLGVFGLHFNPEDQEEAVWASWTAYAPQKLSGLSRNRYRLVQKAVAEAYGTGRKYFRVCTSDFPEEHQANRLYDRLGIKVYRTKKAEDGEHSILYRQAETRHVAKQLHVD
jgi:cation diffusion facilitator family transporter